MTADFESIHNYHERAVFDAVLAALPDHPHLQGSELLADIACVALNRLPPRYIRHAVDFSFYLSEKERNDIEKAINESVAFAFQFVTGLGSGWHMDGYHAILRERYLDNSGALKPGEMGVGGKGRPRNRDAVGTRRAKGAHQHVDRVVREAVALLAPPQPAPSAQIPEVAKT